jgi:hypothetical protein
MLVLSEVCVPCPVLLLIITIIIIIIIIEDVAHLFLDAIGNRVPLCNFRNHSLFFATSKNSSTTRCVLAADLRTTLLKQILNWNLLYWVVVIIIIIIAIINVHSK